MRPVEPSLPPWMGLACLPLLLACRPDPDTGAGGDEPAQVSGTLASGDLYAVLRLSTGTVAAVVQPPTASDAPRPVILAAWGGYSMEHCRPEGPLLPFESALSSVVVAVPNPDECCMDLCGGQEPDLGGPVTQSAFTDVFRFAAGDLAAWDGSRLADLAGPVTDRLGVHLSSGWGVAALAAMAGDPGSFSALAAVGLYEVPFEPWTLTTALGTIADDPDHERDGDGDGTGWDDARNLQYAPGACPMGACDVPTPSLAWDGLLYLDGDGDGRLTLLGDSPDVDENGAWDGDEDFPFRGLGPGDGSPQQVVLPTQILENALSSGVLTEETWPEDLLPAADAPAFWAERDGPGSLAAFARARPDVRWGIVAAWKDHGVAWPTRPHVVGAYEVLARAGAPVLFEPTEEAFRAIAPDVAPPSTRLDWNEPLSEATVGALVLPASIDRDQARSMNAVDLATWIRDP